MTRHSQLATALLLASFLLRLVTLSASAIWYDEAWSHAMAVLPFGQYLALATSDFSPPLNELLIRPFVAVRDTLFFLRLPALLASAAALWLVYKLTAEYRPLPRLLTALFAGFLPGLLWASQDARSYIILAALYLSAVLFATEGRWLGLTAACGLMLWSHATGPAYETGALALAFLLHPQRWPRILLAGSLSALSYLPWIGNAANGLDVGQHWIPSLTFGGLFGSTVDAFWAGTIADLGPALVFFGLLLLSSVLALSAGSRPARTFGLAFVIPMGVLVLVSAIVRNVIIYRTLTPLLLPFVLWMGAALDDALQAGRVRRWAGYALAGLWTVCLLAGLLRWNPSNRGGQLDQAAADIRAAWQTGDVLYYATGTVALPFDYYLSDLPHAVLDEDMHSGLLSTTGVIGLGYQQADLNYLPHTRAWVVYPVDPLITPLQRNRIGNYTDRWKNCSTVVRSFQFAPIVVCLVER